ncbi:MAG: starch-binding protein [Oscillospiraceae bacterium]|jgi:alpha-amylase|nr:starch-binding protein [Oscillospiraceae bacterium]
MKTNKRILSFFMAAVILATALAAGGIFTAQAAAGKAGDIVYLEYTGSGTPNIYMWLGKGGDGNQNAAWPGAPMTLVESGIYSYTLNNAYENLIFNLNGAQTGDIPYPGNNKIFRAGNNIASAANPEDYNTELSEPSIAITPTSGSNFKTESLNVTVNIANAASATCHVTYGAVLPAVFSLNNGANTFAIGAEAPVGTEITVWVKATNANGSVESTAVYTKKEAAISDGSDGHTTEALGGYYATNPNGQVGKAAAIKMDGSIADWDSSMLIAQGTANDDPRVYCQHSMHENPVDDYALYAAWDNTNLYLMWEMANVQDIVAPGDPFPISQGNQWISNIPIFLALSVDPSKTGDGTDGNGNTLWNSGITFDTYMDTWVAFSTNNTNGPFVYHSDDEGHFNFSDSGENAGIRANTQIGLKWGNETISTSLWGIDQGYGTYNNRVPGDVLLPDAAWTDFYATKHDKSLDMFYEMSIPLELIGTSKTELESNGIGVMKIATYGTSGMNCLPYDMSMQDNADQPYSKDSSSSHEKEDADHITVPFARIGKLLSGQTVKPTVPNPTTPVSTTPVVTNPVETTPNATIPSENYIIGDANLDGSVTIEDATIIQKHLAQLEALNPTAFAAADADRSGTVEIGDATSIQKFLAMLNTGTEIGKKPN